MNPGRIDVHSHYFGGLMARMLAQAPPLPGGVTLDDWTTESALAFMDRQGIAAQVLSVPLPFTHPIGEMQPAQVVHRLNEELAEVVRDNPDRFGAFASLPLSSSTAAVRELSHALDDLGLDGVVLPSNADGHYLGEEWFEPVLAELARREVATFVHPTDCPGIAALGFGRPSSVLEFPMDTARTITNAIYGGVFRRHPGLKLVLGHGGGALPSLAWRISVHLELGRGPNDDPGVDRAHVADVLRRLHYETAIASAPHSLRPVLEVTGPENVLFGSDWPAAPESAVAEMVEQLVAFDGFTTDERVDVDRNNALRLFPRLA